MAECEQLARTSAYFDGELPVEDSADVLAHVAECEECRRLLGAAVSIDAAASQRDVARVETKPVDDLAARRERRRWPMVALGAAMLAAAAFLFFVLRPKSSPKQPVAIALPAERAIAGRFTGDAFVPHRPYNAMRSGDAQHEAISLELLAALEKRGDKRNLVAALASSGNLARASQVVAQLGDDPATLSDRAAIALAARDFEAALAHVYRAVDGKPDLLPAWWNLGLVARELGLPYVAKDAFAHVIAAGERGWSDEAKAEVAALDRQIAAQDAGELDKRGRAMLDGGPVLDASDVEQFSAQSRFYYYDGLRVATSKADIDRLRPLAAALDQASGTNTATAAADRVAALDFTVRSKVAAKYRELATQRMPIEDRKKLVDELRALGSPVADIYFGAAVLTGQNAERYDELAAIAKPWGDPWFDLLLVRDRVRAKYPSGDLRAEPALLAALATCTNVAWSLRCGQLALEHGALLLASGRIEEAEQRIDESLEYYERARGALFARHARTFLAEIHRRRGRFALARAEFEESIHAARKVGHCDLVRYSEIGRAMLAFMARDLEAARRFLPSAKPAEGCTPGSDVIGLATAVDLARITNDPRDHTAARAWVEHAKTSGGGPMATISEARLVPASAESLSAVRKWLAAGDAGHENDALRLYGYSTLITDAGSRGAWAEVLDVAKAEYRLTGDVPCLLVTSLDDDKLTIAVRAGSDVAGHAEDVRPPAVAKVPPAITSKLASCSGIAVIARTQTHGRADLLPPAYPWWFAGDGSRAVAKPGPAKAVQIIDVKPPDLGPTLPRLPALAASREKFDVTLAGADASPDRVLAALGTATYAEIHAHGIVSAANADAAFLALSPGPDGTFALDAGKIRKAKLPSAPFVVLAACRAAAVASVFRERWSLPEAFLVAGARGVIAADAPIPDADARAVLDEIHHRIAGGEDPATAVAAIRKARGGWTHHLMLFR